MQISGDIKRVDVTPTVALGVLLVGLVAFGVGRSLRRLEPSPRFERVTTFLAATGWYAPFCIGLVGYYTLLSSQTWLWYFAPLALYGTAILVHGAADLLDGAAEEGPSLSAGGAGDPPAPAAGRVPVPRPPVRRPAPALHPGGQP